ncbi:GNAT family N-acetyltransferase [Streptomyces apocyni]|uniref:GNAT family N-acetyltransferase n=1 Tax=Streptomyces apocyni TaxID=2654677 RepID=UPI0012EA7B7B|nr:GNAT family N-acetyltransferase [Streptomyces apocyni]
MTQAASASTPTPTLALFDEQLRRDARPDGPCVRVERSGEVVRQLGNDGGWTAVIWSDLTEATADAAIAAQVQHFTTLGRRFEWKLYAHDHPTDLAARLTAAGFTAEPLETVMAAQVSDLPRHPELPDGVRFVPVTDEAGVDLTMRVHDQAFGTDGSHIREQLLAQLAQSPDTTTMTVAMAGDTPVCAARVEFHPGTDFASLWGGGTHPAWRGRGIYRALIAHRAHIAATHGYRYLQVDASPQSRPILQRLGFHTLTTTTPYTYEP